MFQGLSTALTGLYASQQGLDTTGNNIANANTEGYSRQRVDQAGINGPTAPSFGTKNSNVGLGVTVTDIARLRDQFFEARGLQEHATQGQMNQSQATLSTIELSFGEPGDHGLQAQMSNFWSSWDDVANNPGDAPARSSVTETGQTLVTSVQQAASDLSTLQSSSVGGLKNDVAQINSMATSIAGLNKEIRTSTASGVIPNALLDQRDLLVSKMSDMVGVTVTPTTQNGVAVTIGGEPIVRDDSTMQLQVDDSKSPIVLRWDQDGNPATVTDGAVATGVSGGTIGGLMTDITTTIPKYQQQLDAIAQKLITTTNTQQAAGLDQNGNPGGPFFTGTSAATIAVSTPLDSTPSMLAAAGAGTGALDGTNALAMANLGLSQTGPDSTYRQMIDSLGVESQRATRQVAIQTTITNSVDAARQSTSGVSLDEEMTNMIKYQQAYNASAKYMSVINDTLGSLIAMVA